MSAFPEPARSFVRRHFFTLLVVALVMAILIAINLLLERRDNLAKWYYGWPLFAYRSRGQEFSGIMLSGLIFDVLAAISIAGLIALICEWLSLFRRTIGKPLFQFSVRAVISASLLGGVLILKNLAPNSDAYHTIGSHSEEISIEAADALMRAGSIDAVGRDRFYGWPYEYATYSESGMVNHLLYRASEGRLDWVYSANHGAAKRNLAYDIFVWLSLILFTLVWMSPSRPPIPDRGWLNLHLSSVVVMANITGLCYIENATTYLAHVPYNGWLTQGWPLRAIAYKEYVQWIGYEISYGAVAVNVFVAIVLASGAAYANEYLLRRRQA